MNKKKIAFSVVILTIIITMWQLVKHHGNGGGNDQDAVWVSVTQAKKIPLSLETHAIGTLVAKSVEITPEIAGHVQKIFFEDGAFVESGVPLIQLDDAVYKAQYTSASAKLAYSESNFKRMEWLGKHGAIAKQAIDQADADLKENRAATEEAKVMLEKTKLLAPFAGMAGKSKVDLGDYVTVGQSLVTITNTKHLHIEYNISEKYLPSLKKGQEVKITTATYPNKIFSGTIAYISPTINPENRSVSLYAEVPNPDGLLAGGMFVNVIHTFDNKENAIVIPARSLVPILDGMQVYKVVNNKAYSVDVVVGRRTDNAVQILQGINVGDVIVTDGQLKIKTGMPVKFKS